MRRNPLRKAVYLKVSHPWFSSSLSPHDKPSVHMSIYYGLQKRYGSQSSQQRESMGFKCQLCVHDFCQGTGTFCLVGQIPAAYCVSCVLWSLQINYGHISLLNFLKGTLHPPKWPFVTLNSWRTHTLFLVLPHAKNPKSKKSLNNWSRWRCLCLKTAKLNKTLTLLTRVWTFKGCLQKRASS